MKNTFIAFAAAALALSCNAAETLQEIIDAATANSTVALTADYTVSDTIEITKSLLITGSGHSVTADSGFSGPVFKISGEDTYVQLRGINITGANGVEVSGGGRLALQSCTLTGTDADGSVGVRLCDIATTNVTQIGKTPISGFTTGVEITSAATGGTVYVYGGESSGGGAIKAVNPIVCDGSGVTLRFANADLYCLSGSPAAMWFGDEAQGNSLVFTNTLSYIYPAAADIPYASVPGYGAISGLSFAANLYVNVVGTSQNTATFFTIRDVTSWRDYVYLNAATTGDGSIYPVLIDSETSRVTKTYDAMSPSTTVVAANGKTLYSSVDELKATLTDDDFELSFGFDSAGLPHCELVKTNDFYGIDIAIKYASELSDSVDWQDWPDGTLDTAPAQLFFQSQLEE